MKRSIPAHLALLLLFAANSLNAAYADGPGDKVESRVRQALNAVPGGRVFVIVMFRDAERLMLLADRARRVADVRAVREQVLRGCERGDVTPAHEWDGLPAITAWVNRRGLERLAASPHVAQVGADERMQAEWLASSVPFIRANLAHNAGYDGAGTTVAVIDSGVDFTHADLAASMAPGAWHITNQGSVTGPGANDVTGHGTSVAGVITADGITVPRGVAPAADVLAVRVFDTGGTSFLSDTAAAINYVVQQAAGGALVAAINISLVSFTLYSQCPCDAQSASNQLLAAAISAAWLDGIACFVCSGNDSRCGQMGSPACIGNAVAVAAVSDPGLPPLIAGFSNRSACNDLSAPGVSILTTRLGGGTTNGVGTSYSAPHAAGVAALMTQRDRDDCDRLTAEQIVGILKSTAIPATDACNISPHPPMIDAWASLTAIPLRGDFAGGVPVAQPPPTDGECPIPSRSAGWERRIMRKLSEPDTQPPLAERAPNSDSPSPLTAEGDQGGSLKGRGGGDVRALAADRIDSITQGSGSPPPIIGDGIINAADIPGFVSALLGAGDATFRARGDVNCDNRTDGDDARLFVTLLLR